MEYNEIQREHLPGGKFGFRELSNCLINLTCLIAWLFLFLFHFLCFFFTKTSDYNMLNVNLNIMPSHCHVILRNRSRS